MIMYYMAVNGVLRRLLMFQLKNAKILWKTLIKYVSSHADEHDSCLRVS